jgi:hypothetical protein
MTSSGVLLNIEGDDAGADVPHVFGEPQFSQRKEPPPFEQLVSEPAILTK